MWVAEIDKLNANGQISEKPKMVKRCDRVNRIENATNAFACMLYASGRLRVHFHKISSNANDY